MHDGSSNDYYYHHEQQHGMGWTKARVISSEVLELESDPVEESPDAQVCRHIPMPESAHLLPCLEDELTAVEDMNLLEHLNEPVMIYNLRHRFRQGQPYTCSGDMILAVNPHSWDISSQFYSKSNQLRYLEQQLDTPDQDDRCALAPHIYTISARAHSHLKIYQTNQSIIVTGESGSGKTETTKLLIHHLILAGDGANDSPSSISHRITHRILQSNPIMESFGNAATLQNANSSRFGKFIQLYFDTFGSFVAAQYRTYLLETSRVVSCPGTCPVSGAQERNYHIFYQFLSTDAAFQHSLGFNYGDRIEFPWLGNTAPRQEDLEDWNELVASFTTLGLSTSDQVEIFRLIGCMLYLSVLAFYPKNDDDTNEEHQQERGRIGFRSNVSLDVQPHILQYIVEVLGLTSKDELELMFCTRSISISNEHIACFRTCQEAETCRNSFVIAIYSHVFDVLVNRLNAQLGKIPLLDDDTTDDHNDPEKKRSWIGLLDIFGFEFSSTRENGFEQLCINFANEKLHDQFLRDTFHSIQQEYHDEGIEWINDNDDDDDGPSSVVPETNNIRMVKFIEGPCGVFALLNEECLRPRGTDTAFLSKLVKSHDQHFSSPHEPVVFSLPQVSSASFFLHHYAGQVKYSCVDFCFKNKQHQHQELYSVLVQRLLSSRRDDGHQSNSSSPAVGRRSKVLNRFRGSQFKRKLNVLLSDIHQTSVHYIRCLQPNRSASPLYFSKSCIAQQLRYAGVLRATALRRKLYPYRMTHLKSTTYFHALVSHMDNNKPLSFDLWLTQVMHQIQIDDPPTEDHSKVMIQVGKTRVYFTHQAFQRLSRRRWDIRQAAATMIQRHVRGALAYFNYRDMIEACRCIQRLVRTKNTRARFRALKSQVILIQLWYRTLVTRRRRNMQRRHVKSVRIQAWTRMLPVRKHFLRQRHAVDIIQHHARRYLEKVVWIRLEQEQELLKRYVNMVYLNMSTWYI